jgi:hypothetical protein
MLDVMHLSVLYKRDENHQEESYVRRSTADGQKNRCGTRKDAHFRVAKVNRKEGRQGAVGEGKERWLASMASRDSGGISLQRWTEGSLSCAPEAFRFLK